MKKRFFSRTDLLFLFFITLAFALRAICLRQTISFLQPGSGSDSDFYLRWAMDILRGNIARGEVFYALPLYPYFLSLAYLYAEGNVFGLVLIQIIIGSVNCGLIYLLGKKLFNQQVGVLAGLLSCAYLMFIFYDRMLLPTSLVIFLGLVLALSLLNIPRHPGLGKWIIPGVLLGLVALAKASFALVALFILLWIIFNYRNVSLKRRFLYYLCFVLPFILFISGTTLRNYLVAKDPVLITAHSGINFYIGNNSQASGLFKVPPHMRATQPGLLEDARIIAQAIEGRELKASEVSNFWFKQALRFMRKEPKVYLRLLGKKLLLFWNNREYVDDIEYYLFVQEAALFSWPLVRFAYIGPLALLGLFLSWSQRKKVALIYVFIFSLMLATISFFINARYRLVAVPYLIVLAGFSLWRIQQMFRQKRYRGSIICLVSLFILYFLGNIEFGKPDSNLDFILHYNKGVYLSDQNDYDNAQKEFHAAVRLKPSDYMSYLGLGNVYYQEGDYTQAVNCYQKSLELNPYFYKAVFNLGFIHYEQKNYLKAEQEFKRVLQINPGYCAGYYNLGRVYQKQGLYDKALRQYEQALAIKPGHPEVLEAIKEIKGSK